MNKSILNKLCTLIIEQEAEVDELVNLGDSHEKSLGRGKQSVLNALKKLLAEPNSQIPIVDIRFDNGEYMEVFGTQDGYKINLATIVQGEKHLELFDTDHVDRELKHQLISKPMRKFIQSIL